MAERFRHEYKYIIDSRQECILRLLAEGVLLRDPHVQADGSYIIRSLYFDDRFDSCMEENESGIDPRSKFRIRYYNDNPEVLKLEKKSKTRGMTLKNYCDLSPKECRELMENGSVNLDDSMSPEKKALLTEFRMRGLQPKVIVTYERHPFIYPGGNVRVTFDGKITSSPDVGCFLTGDYFQRPILPLGDTVLEVKWDEVFPWHLQETLQLDTLQWTAFSKYYLCRKYHL